jgi:DNA-binding transcriptional ArsR family regulator
MRISWNGRHSEIKPPDRGNVLHLISNELRSEIIERLAIEPMDVSNLARCMELDVKYISHQLGLLLKCSLVRMRAQGTRHCYELGEVVKVSTRGPVLRIRIECAGGKRVVLQSGVDRALFRHAC